MALDVIQWCVLLNTEMGLRFVENGENVGQAEQMSAPQEQFCFVKF